MESMKEKKDKISFDDQLSAFLDCGFQLNPGVGEFELNQWPRTTEEFENKPFSHLYQVLGQPVNRERMTPFTNQCWFFNLECVEGNGVYVNIMQNISRISNGELQFENLKDHVDFRKREAWISFDCNGEACKWDLKVDDDWADGEIFEMVQGLAEKYNTTKRFTYFDSGGSTFVLGYHSHEELKKLIKLTGLKIAWLDPEVFNDQV